MIRDFPLIACSLLFFSSVLILFFWGDSLGYFDPSRRRFGLILLVAACAMLSYWGWMVIEENTNPFDTRAGSSMAIAIALPTTLLSAWLLLSKSPEG